jgi:hypothetical protein
MEIDGNKKTKIGHMYGEDLKLNMLLQVWGECSMVKVTGNMKLKMKLHGKMGIFVGYVDDCTLDTYCIYLPDLNTIHETKDVQWCKKSILNW